MASHVSEQLDHDVQVPQFPSTAHTAIGSEARSRCVKRQNTIYDDDGDVNTMLNVHRNHTAY